MAPHNPQRTDQGQLRKRARGAPLLISANGKGTRQPALNKADFIRYRKSKAIANHACEVEGFPVPITFEFPLRHQRVKVERMLSRTARVNAGERPHGRPTVRSVRPSVRFPSSPCKIAQRFDAVQVDRSGNQLQPPRRFFATAPQSQGGEH
jgi:hypothetical protein